MARPRVRGRPHPDGPAVVPSARTLDAGRGAGASALHLGLLLVVEGIGFGVFLVSSQAAVSGASGQTNRGAAVGIFWMAGAAGEVVGLVFVGIVASALGLLAVFSAVAATAVVSAVVVAGLGLLALQDSRQDARVEVAARDDAHHTPQ